VRSSRVTRAGATRADTDATQPPRLYTGTTEWYPQAGTLALVAGRHPRVQVTRDPELERAIVRGRGVFGPGLPSSKVLHALAIRGAAALDQERQAEGRARDFLISVAKGSSGLDLEGLRSVRDRAWR
jgi:hypothetical protein